MCVLELLSAAAALVAGLLTLAVLGGASLELPVVAMILCFAVVGWQMVTFFMGAASRRDRVGRRLKTARHSRRKAESDLR